MEAKIFDVRVPLEAPVRHAFGFDPTHGLDLDGLLRVELPDTPGDFEAFWRARFRAVCELDADPVVSESPVGQSGHSLIFDLSYRSSDGVRVRGWLTKPKDCPVTSVGIVGHGYCGRDSADPNPPLPGMACLFPCLRGLGLTPFKGVDPADVGTHVLSGIHHRETYIHGGCVDDTWCAASAAGLLFPDFAQRLVYVGGSFGGGIGALALPWDDRFIGGVLTDPSFGNYPVRVVLPCTGSGAVVSEYWRRHPEILGVLAGFDAATAAKFCRKPVMVMASVFDPAVAPPSQFSVFRALPGTGSLIVKSFGHFEHRVSPAESAAAARKIRPFLQSLTRRA